MVTGSEKLNSEIFQNEELKLDMDLTSTEEGIINKLNTALTEMTYKENEEDEEEKLVTKTDIIDVAKNTKIKIDVDMDENDEEKYEQKTLEEILVDVDKYLDHDGTTWKIKTKEGTTDVPAYIQHIADNESGSRDIAFLIQTFGSVMLGVVERGYASRSGDEVSRDQIFGGQTMNVAKKSLGAVEHEEVDVSKVIETGLDALDAEVDQLSHTAFEQSAASRRVDLRQNQNRPEENDTKSEQTSNDQETLSLSPYPYGYPDLTEESVWYYTARTDPTDEYFRKDLEYFDKQGRDSRNFERHKTRLQGYYNRLNTVFDSAPTIRSQHRGAGPFLLKDIRTFQHAISYPSKHNIRLVQSRLYNMSHRDSAPNANDRLIEQYVYNERDLFHFDNSIAKFAYHDKVYTVFDGDVGPEFFSSMDLLLDVIQKAYHDVAKGSDNQPFSA